MHNWIEIFGSWPTDNKLLSYNVAPTNIVPIVAGQGVFTASWGLVPPWSQSFSMKYSTFNARIETVAGKASFRSAWRNKQTCIVPIGGYYEWRVEDGVKQAYVVHDDQGPTILAGIWEAWHDQYSFTILTENAQGELAKLHPRMPIRLNQEQSAAWLHGEMAITNHSWQKLSYYKVGRQVGNIRNDGPELIEALANDNISD